MCSQETDSVQYQRNQNTFSSTSMLNFMCNVLRVLLQASVRSIFAAVMSSFLDALFGCLPTNIIENAHFSEAYSDLALEYDADLHACVVEGDGSACRRLH